MILLQKTNADWWNVRKSNGHDGFVPANYVIEIEPKIVRKRGQKVLKVPEKRKIKKTVMKKQVVKKKKQTLPYSMYIYLFYFPLVEIVFVINLNLILLIFLSHRNVRFF